MMAGSLSHIVDDDGSFRMDLIENLGDAHEALEECFDVIAEMAGGDLRRLKQICKRVRACAPRACPVVGKRRPDDDAEPPDPPGWEGGFADNH